MKDIVYWIQDIHNIHPGGFICWEVVWEDAPDGPEILAAGRIRWDPVEHADIQVGDVLSREEMFDLIRDKCIWIYSGSQDDYLPESNEEDLN